MERVVVNLFIARLVVCSFVRDFVVLCDGRKGLDILGLPRQPRLQIRVHHILASRQHNVDCSLVVHHLHWQVHIENVARNGYGRSLEIYGSVLTYGFKRLDFKPTRHIAHYVAWWNKRRRIARLFFLLLLILHPTRLDRVPFLQLLPLNRVELVPVARHVVRPGRTVLTVDILLCDRILTKLRWAFREAAR